MTCTIREPIVPETTPTIILNSSFAFNRNEPKALIYFKVERVVGPLGDSKDNAALLPMAVDIHASKLTQEGSCNSRIPSPLLRSFALQDNFHGNSHSPSSSHPPGMVASYKTLEKLVGAATHSVFSMLNIDSSIIIHGLRGIGKRTLVHQVARNLGLHVYERSGNDIAGETEKKTEANLRTQFEKAQERSPCIFLLRNIESLSPKPDNNEDPNSSKFFHSPFLVFLGESQSLLLFFFLSETGVSNAIKESLKGISDARKGNPDGIVAFIATTDDMDAVPVPFQSRFSHQILIQSPDEKARLEMLQALLTGVPIGYDVNVKALATKTAAMLPIDLCQVVSDAVSHSLKRVSHSKVIKENPELVPLDIELAGTQVVARDFDKALDMAHAVQADSIGAAKIPNVTWQDVGGLASVKEDILDTIQLPLDHPELFASGLRQRSGILLYGPPGTGKTLLAKAVATECSLNFLSVKGPELINMYVGESEKNVRDVFQKAVRINHFYPKIIIKTTSILITKRNAKPCVIFFDELDSLAPNRGRAGDSGGVMDRIVSQLLAELDGVNNGGDVFVIGATNRPDLIDPALLRPGRFDKLIYLSISEDHDSQLKIIQALTRK